MYVLVKWFSVLESTCSSISAAAAAVPAHPSVGGTRCRLLSTSELGSVFRRSVLAGVLRDGFGTRWLLSLAAVALAA